MTQGGGIVRSMTANALEGLWLKMTGGLVGIIQLPCQMMRTIGGGGSWSLVGVGSGCERIRGFSGEQE